MENNFGISKSKPVYTCPTCEEKMERDLVLFTQHTDAHVVEELKKTHPEWITDEGFCPQCLAHYKAAMRGEAVAANTKKNHCVVLGMKGAMNMDQGEEPVSDAVEKKSLRRESANILWISFFLAMALTVAVYYLF